MTMVGFSGGSMERPALQALLADIGAGRIDVIVVYKVDRLTRSLTDFAKIVEVFDARGVSFVSVTQQFNTTSSMGRLTLNVLLSFAQFEREVTGERIRDKIAASKKKGRWMGGFVPIGCSANERTLVINEPEAAKVREIFGLYLEHRCVRRVQAELDRLKLSPLRVSAGEIEAIVVSQVRAVLSDPERMMEALALRGAKPNMLRDALSKARSLAAALEDASPQNCRAVIANIIARIALVEGGLKILLDRRALAVHLMGCSRAGDEFYAIEAPLIFTRRGAEMLLITKNDCSSGAHPPDLPLLKALARGHTWFAALASGRAKSVRELARQEGVTDRYISRQLTFAFMAPQLVEAIVVAEEQHLSWFCIEDLREDQLPLSWHRQSHIAFGKADRRDSGCRGNAALGSTAAALSASAPANLDSGALQSNPANSGSGRKLQLMH
jgi:DNA invertase Pin-like site-specific DNA recombinase